MEMPDNKLGWIGSAVLGAITVWNFLTKSKNNIGEQAVSRYKQVRDIEEQAKHDEEDRAENAKMWKRICALEDEAIRAGWTVRRDS